MPTRRKLPDLKPLKLSCTRTECENELHCYRESKKRSRYPSGACQVCGATLVDWPRVKLRNSADVAHTLDALRTECVRHDFWHLEINQRAANYALRKGRSGLRVAAEKRIRSAVGIKTSLDGRQTSWDKDILCYAQHATACCCRRCMDYWHGIPPDQPLTEEHVIYFTDLCLRYIFERMPDLPEHGQHVPPIRRGEGNE
jgi:uncharacterized protein DUF4186